MSYNSKRLREEIESMPEVHRNRAYIRSMLARYGADIEKMEEGRLPEEPIGVGAGDIGGNLLARSYVMDWVAETQQLEDFLRSGVFDSDHYTPELLSQTVKPLIRARNRAVKYRGLAGYEIAGGMIPTGTEGRIPTGVDLRAMAEAQSKATFGLPEPARRLVDEYLYGEHSRGRTGLESVVRYSRQRLGLPMSATRPRAPATAAPAAGGAGVGAAAAKPSSSM
jgi:hypothetical protein